MRTISLIFVLILSSLLIHSQDIWNPFNSILGNWKGNGTGFSSGKSNIESSFNLVLDNKYIEVKNESHFEPTDNNPAGEVHKDRGLISYDKNNKKYVFRQFHNEGFVIQYIMNEAMSNDSVIVFDSEIIENFVEGGKARFTINILSENEIETLFDVSFPGKEFACFGKNNLQKINPK